jgi:large subunit ribosomal protein L23
MPMFWSKKSKAEKNYAENPAPTAKNMPGKQGKKQFKPDTKVSRAPKILSKTIVPKTPAKNVIALPSGSFSGATGAIIRPRITEKSGLLSQSGVYTFEVGREANKQSISKAVKALYKVIPVKIAVLNSPAKNVFVKGRRGKVSGFRKAMVTLKKGDKIDFV